MGEERKETMTLNLSVREMEVLSALARDKDMSKTAILRQALRIYQLIDVRLQAGERMFFSGDREREMLFVGGLGEPRNG